MHDQRPVQSDPLTDLRLPLVAIEHYMLADDRADYPMVFYVRLILSRLPDREMLKRAVSETAGRHPLLVATVTQPDGRRRDWTWQRPLEPEIVFPDDLDSGAPPDISHQSGLRVKVEEIADGACITLQFHHACCDGLGALKFTEEMLLVYGAQNEQADGGSESPSRLTRSDFDEVVGRLMTRGRFGVGPIRFMLRLPLELLGALGVLEFLLHRPAPLVGAEKEEPSQALRASVEEPIHWPRRYAHEFTPEETKALRSAAASAGVTLNDLFVRDLFLTVGGWIDQKVPSKRGAHVRVMVPVNLRTSADADLSAANVVAMINLDRRPRRWRNHRRMLRVLHWEMAAVKWARLGLTFIRAIQFTHYVLGKLKKLLAADKCQATCVLSNLGEPWRNSGLAQSDDRVMAGDLEVRRAELLPPIRPLTSLSIGVMTLAGRMTVAFHCDRRVLSDNDANALLRNYVERLRGSMIDQPQGASPRFSSTGQ